MYFNLKVIFLRLSCLQNVNTKKNKIYYLFEFKKKKKRVVKLYVRV